MIRTAHVGPHASLTFGYADLLRWADAHGHAVSGCVYETYLDDPAEVDSRELRTELALPLG